MALKTIDALSLAGKRVFIRVDFNVPLDAQGRVTDDARIREFAQRMPAYRVMVNTSAPQGSVGITTNLQPSMTLGCGAVGGNSDLNNQDHGVPTGTLGAGGYVASTPVTLTVGGDNTTTAFSGAVSGFGGLTKFGTGTFTISGANTYAGATTVSGGTLRLAAPATPLLKR